MNINDFNEFSFCQNVGTYTCDLTNNLHLLILHVKSFITDGKYVFPLSEERGDKEYCVTKKSVGTIVQG